MALTPYYLPLPLTPCYLQFITYPMSLAPCPLPLAIYFLPLASYHLPFSSYLLSPYYLPPTAYHLPLTHYFLSLTNYTHYLNPSASYHLSFISYQLSYPSLPVLLGEGQSLHSHIELNSPFLRIIMKSTKLGRPSKAVNMVYSVKDQRHTRKCAPH